MILAFFVSLTPLSLFLYYVIMIPVVGPAIDFSLLPVGIVMVAAARLYAWKARARAKAKGR